MPTPRRFPRKPIERHKEYEIVVDDDVTVVRHPPATRQLDYRPFTYAPYGPAVRKSVYLGWVNVETTTYGAFVMTNVGGMRRVNCGMLRYVRMRAESRRRGVRPNHGEAS